MDIGIEADDRWLMTRMLIEINMKTKKTMTQKKKQTKTIKNNNLEKQTQEEQKKYSSRKQCFIPLCYPHYMAAA